MRELSLKKKAMEKRQAKTSKYLEEVKGDVERLIHEIDDKESLFAPMESLVIRKVKESFKNGLEVGRKQRTGQNRQHRKPYRKYRK